MLYLMVKRKVLELLYVLFLVLVLDVEHGVQHVPEILKSFQSIYIKLGRNVVSFGEKKSLWTTWLAAPGFVSRCPPWCPICPWGTWKVFSINFYSKTRQKWWVSWSKKVHEFFDGLLLLLVLYVHQGCPWKKSIFFLWKMHIVIPFQPSMSRGSA